MARGAIFIAAKPSTLGVLKTAATDLGLTFTAVTQRPTGALYKLNPRPRIGLWDQYGGSMPSGWVRFMLEQFEFPFEVVYPAGRSTPATSRRSSTCCSSPMAGFPRAKAAAVAVAAAVSRRLRTFQRNTRTSSGA